MTIALPEFLLTHHHEHINCLAQFFDVVVIDEVCDYERMCNRHRPDLAVFELGVNILTCKRPNITNLNRCPEVPKVGLINADGWCETRSGLLSEADHLGVETFFSIAATAGEHLASIAGDVFIWPNCVDTELYKDYQEHKVIPVLLTGATGTQYPWRRKINKLISANYPALLCPHRGYLARSGPGQVIFGKQYARTINASLIAPACGTMAREVVRKHFEIPACRTCLITEESPALKAAGFVDMTNCVFADEQNILDKLEYLFGHRDELGAITDAGFEMIHSRHTSKNRDQLLQWLQLRATLRPGQRIIQEDPFSPLRVVENEIHRANAPFASGGEQFRLLSDGDRELAEDRYQEARQLYLTCLSQMQRLPEAKLRLAICDLYAGDARSAFRRVFDLIQYTIDEYKAPEPDPIEWAFYIISLLCLGKLREAEEAAGQFTTVRHPDLDSARLAVRILRTKAISSVAEGGSLRHSIHVLPEQLRSGWIQQLAKMLTACGQADLAIQLLSGPEAPQVNGREVHSTGQSAKGERKGSRSGSLKRRLIRHKVEQRLSSMFAGISNATKRALPPLASKKVDRTKKILQVIEELLRHEKIGRVLVLADGTTYDQEIERALAASGVVPVVRAALPSKGEIEGFDLIVAQNEYEQLEVHLQSRRLCEVHFVEQHQCRLQPLRLQSAPGESVSLPGRLRPSDSVWVCNFQAT